MKSIIFTITALSCAISAMAQTETSDSIPAQELQEIVIQAPKVIRKADMDLYYPSESAVNHSQNGLQLLNNLMIPTLTVSDALGTIQAAGQSVQVRINGSNPQSNRCVLYSPKPSNVWNGLTTPVFAMVAQTMC